MTREILLSVKGMHNEFGADRGNQDEPIEIVTSADYFNKNGKHYIIYEEIYEGAGYTSKNKVKIANENLVEIKKNGYTTSNMIFEKGKETITRYETPMGVVFFEVYTSDIILKEMDEGLDLKLVYTMSVEGEPIAQCEVQMQARSKGNGDVQLVKAMMEQ